MSDPLVKFISEVPTLTVSSSEFLMAVPSHLLTRIGSSSSDEPAEEEDEEFWKQEIELLVHLNSEKYSSLVS